MTARWDIFCTVVDNYGDIGVTWRLARQLAAEHAVAVRLWVDEPAAFQRICPQAEAGLSQWLIAGVEVRYWSQDFPEVTPADVVVEAFACTLPASYVAAMRALAVKPLWLNLEYLSAEDWVAGCHGLPSPQGSGLTKYFFFPGFTQGTGGLLREAQLLTQRDALQGSAQAQAAFLASLSVQRQVGARLISLFAYENPSLAPWLTLLAQASQSTQVLVPQGRIEADVAAWLGQPLVLGQVYHCGALSVQLLPFMAQDDYDRLLWCCDFNAVRGEDSFVRAQWAARPLLWHIYQQEEEAHWDKLEAFLALYCADLDASAAQALRALWRAWNGRGEMAQAWSQWLAQEKNLQAHAAQWAQKQAGRTDLAATLVQFPLN